MLVSTCKYQYILGSCLASARHSTELPSCWQHMQLSWAFLAQAPTLASSVLAQCVVRRSQPLTGIAASSLRRKTLSASTGAWTAQRIRGSHPLVQFHALELCVPDPGPWRGGPTLSCDRGCPDPNSPTEVISRSYSLQKSGFRINRCQHQQPSTWPWVATTVGTTEDYPLAWHLASLCH